jgi:hypothetical protein
MTGEANRLTSITLPAASAPVLNKERTARAQKKTRHEGRALLTEPKLRSV